MKWRSKNKDSLNKKQREFLKKNNYKWQKKWFKKELANNPSFRIKHYLRKKLTDSFRDRGIRRVGTSKKYGIDYAEMVSYLEKTLPKDFNERKYHIDHILPISSFDLNDPNQVKSCFSKNNIRWLLADENLNKKNKIEVLINY